jgi:hypothetical protein
MKASALWKIQGRLLPTSKSELTFIETSLLVSEANSPLEVIEWDLDMSTAGA